MSNNPIEHQELFKELSQLIEQGKRELAVQVNRTMTLVFWQVGKRINEDILKQKRAEYGKEILSSLASSLSQQFGRSFQHRNLRRMMQFAIEFPDIEIVSTLSTQLSWSHFVELLPIQSEEARIFYANKIAEERWSVRQTRKQIERKTYERNAIASSKLPNVLDIYGPVFKDPYFLDFLGLTDGYLEDDLEAAILKELELFILELGMGFTFVERQKRMIIDGEDFYSSFFRTFPPLITIQASEDDEYRATNSTQPHDSDCWNHLCEPCSI